MVSTPLAFEWNATQVLRGHTHWVQSLALLQGGRLASGDWGGTVRLWDVARGGEATTVLEGHVESSYRYALAALHDGRRLASSAREGKGIVVWDTGLVPPTRCATIDCSSLVNALAVLRDGRLAAGCADDNVRLVEVGAGAGAVTATLKGHTRLVRALAVLPDGTLASGADDRTVRVWDVRLQTCVAILAGHMAGVNALAVLADGRLASGSGDNSVRLWDVARHACVGVLEGHKDMVDALAALPDGRLVSGSTDCTIRVWDTRRPAAAAGGIGARILALATRCLRRAVVVLKGHKDTVVALQPLPDGRLASGSWDGTVRLWRVPPP